MESGIQFSKKNKEGLMKRKITKTVRIGDRLIGGGYPILIQSMTNTRTDDVAATVRQINSLADAGCEIIRCAVPDQSSALALREIKKEIGLPLVADIHFDYKLAIAAMENGADKIRINPGNIGSRSNIKAFVVCALDRGIQCRVGLISGWLVIDILAKYGGVTAEGLAESALDKARLIEDLGYDNLVLSIKSSDVPVCVKAHELASEKTDHPFHIGITEAGTLVSGAVKSAVGLALLLDRGIGDTIRVSLTGDPLPEIRTAKQILRDMGIRRTGIEVISCPTCGRTKIDLDSLSGRVETMLAGYDLNLRVAVMGCEVNGPGEAREADLGIAGGDGEGLVFRKGQIVRKVPESGLLEALKEELDHWE